MFTTLVFLKTLSKQHMFLEMLCLAFILKALTIKSRLASDF